MKGIKVNSLEEYEKRQSEIAKKLGVKRYAGRVYKGKVMPDLHLKDGGYFIPYAKGEDEIKKEDIKQFEI